METPREASQFVALFWNVPVSAWSGPGTDWIDKEGSAGGGKREFMVAALRKVGLVVHLRKKTQGEKGPRQWRPEESEMLPWWRTGSLRQGLSMEGQRHKQGRRQGGKAQGKGKGKAGKDGGVDEEGKGKGKTRSCGWGVSVVDEEEEDEADQAEEVGRSWPVGKRCGSARRAS